jgi:hypothetical protein
MSDNSRFTLISMFYPTDRRAGRISHRTTPFIDITWYKNGESKQRRTIYNPRPQFVAAIASVASPQLRNDLTIYFDGWRYTHRPAKKGDQ